MVNYFIILMSAICFLFSSERNIFADDNTVAQVQSGISAAAGIFGAISKVRNNVANSSQSVNYPYVELTKAMYNLPLGVSLGEIVKWGNEKTVKISPPKPIFSEGVAFISNNKKFFCNHGDMKDLYSSIVSPSQEMKNDGVTGIAIFFRKDNNDLVSYAAAVSIETGWQWQLITDVLNKKYRAYCVIEAPKTAGVVVGGVVGDYNAPTDITYWDVFYLTGSSFNDKVMWKRNIVGNAPGNGGWGGNILYYEPNISKTIIASIKEALGGCQNSALQEDDKLKDKF
ncbi:MAG: hypothetical protein NTY47_03540 [Candidatus Omnitrophica bacterium]|nr:hypothetical protein [Candidatus Omnitrophota bacterium]